MSDTKPPLNKGTLSLLARLNKLLGEKWMVRLADGIDDIKEETGYVQVKLIFADKRIVNVKVEESYCGNLFYN
jgi:hypothetical protein